MRRAELEENRRNLRDVNLQEEKKACAEGDRGEGLL